MRLRHVFAVLSASFALPCNGSEGLLYASLYYCNANAVNEAIVSACATNEPTLAAQAGEALSSWKGRYGERAQRAAAECAKSLSDAEAKRFHAEAVRAWVSELESRAKHTDGSYCRQVISQLNAGSMDRDIWK